MPDCSHRYRNKFLTIRYARVNFTFRTSCRYVKGLRPGDLVELLHKEGTSIFLFTNENVTTDLLLLIVLILGIIAFLIYTFNKRL
jgi:hypothetical protein